MLPHPHSLLRETPAKPIGGQRTEWESGGPPFVRPLWMDVPSRKRPAFAGMT